MPPLGLADSKQSTVTYRRLHPGGTTVERSALTPSSYLVPLAYPRVYHPATAIGRSLTLPSAASICFPGLNPTPRPRPQLLLDTQLAGVDDPCNLDVRISGRCALRPKAVAHRRCLLLWVIVIEPSGRVSPVAFPDQPATAATVSYWRSIDARVLPTLRVRRKQTHLSLPDSACFCRGVETGKFQAVAVT